MKEARVMNCLDALGELSHGIADPVVVPCWFMKRTGAVSRGSTQRLGEAFAADQLHREEQALALEHQLVQSDDVAVPNV